MVAGGSYASLCPEHYAELADTVVAGEAEYIWQQFCADFERGAPKRLYHETGTVALTDSPTPRFDLLKLERYSYAIAAVLARLPVPLRVLRHHRDVRPQAAGQEPGAGRARAGRAAPLQDVRNVFFVDDNLIGNLPMARKLLRYLKEYQEQHDYRFSFGTEASLNMAQDEELLELFRAANFSWVFIGIESPDPASLKETLKTQNLHEDILTSVRRIYANGIDVLAGFIIGFDNDTLDTFEHQYRFITDAGIQSAMIGLLTALPKTPLYERLKKEGRLSTLENASDNTRPSTNVIPKGMPYDDMVNSYIALYRRLLTDREIALRIRNKVRHLRSPVYRSVYAPPQALGILWRLVRKGILPGGPGRVWHLLRSMPWLAPSRVPTVISDWIVGLSMRDFAERHLTSVPIEASSNKGNSQIVGRTLDGCQLTDSGV